MHVPQERHTETQWVPEPSSGVGLHCGNVLKSPELEPLKVMLFLVLHMCIRVCLCVGYMHVSGGAFRVQKKE